jgi:YD repeat-containing protein
MAEASLKYQEPAGMAFSGGTGGFDLDTLRAEPLAYDRFERFPTLEEQMTGRVSSIWLTLGSLVLASAFTGRVSAQQQPLWADELVPKQPPARNSVPAKDDPPLGVNNGNDHPEQEDLRRLARIHDDQTYQDTGDPVIPTIGMVSHRVVDLYIPGRGIDFSFERRYSSHDSLVGGPLGFGWDHVYNARLAISQGGAKVTLHDGNGREDVYTTTLPSTVYAAPRGTYTLFKFEAPSTHILRNREGTRTYFVNGLLDRIQDPEGNALKFFYDANSKLDYVIDTMGRTIDFSHDASGRLEWIQDFRGRRVEYYYDAQGNLTGARTPTVASTAGFNDFPNGRVERYTYLSGFNNLLDHKLTGIIRPNDVVSSTPPYGTPTAQFTYEQNPSAVFFGWCKTQVLGGTNAAGAAGGTITYDYQVLDISTLITDPNALKIGRLKAKVTNRKSYRTDYVTNQNGHVIQVTDWSGTTAYTTTNEYNANGELVKITQPNGNFTTISYASGPPSESPLVAGNTVAITDYPGTIPTDQSSRTRAFVYEPIFNNLSTETDPLGRETQYFTDYQEGNSSNIIGQLQAELLGIYTSTQGTRSRVGKHDRRCLLAS